MVSLNTFRTLCGMQNFEHVTLCTTFWDIVEQATGAARERELCETPDCWGRMQRKGSSVVRIHDYAQSHDVLLRLAAKNQMSLEVQEETVTRGLSLENTGASKTLNAQLEAMKAEYEAKIGRAERDAAEKLRKKDEENKRKFRMQKQNQERLDAQIRQLELENRFHKERIAQMQAASIEREVKHEEERKCKIQAEL